MAVGPRVIDVLASIMICSLPVAAQSPGTIRGRVLDSASHQGLSNLMVTVDGTGIGVFTNLEGAFTLARVPAGARQGAPQAAVLTERTAALRRLLVSVPVDCPFHH